MEYLPGVTDPEKKKQAEKCLTTAIPRQAGENILQYKSRSLNGIWATAPYLHNGSVPTLYDLLLPSFNADHEARQMKTPLAVSGETRPRNSDVGSRKFDPVKVGFSADLSDTGEHIRLSDNGQSNGRADPGELQFRP